MKSLRGRAALSLLCVCSGVVGVFTALFIGGCSESLGPDDEGCYGWYQGFYILSTPESLYVRVELDLTWGMPDSAWIFTPLSRIVPDRLFERADPPGLAVASVVNEAISGWYTLRARYGVSARTYEEHVSVRNDVVYYDFNRIEPQRGEAGLSLTPLMRWTELRDTQTRVRVYSDSLREQGIFDSGGIEDTDSLRIPTGVLGPDQFYYWTLEMYDWQTFLPDCTPGYYYMDFFDSGLLYVGWFATADVLPPGPGELPAVEAGLRGRGDKEFPPLDRRRQEEGIWTVRR